MTTRIKWLSLAVFGLAMTLAGTILPTQASALTGLVPSKLFSAQPDGAALLPGAELRQEVHYRRGRPWRRPGYRHRSRGRIGIWIAPTVIYPSWRYYDDPVYYDPPRARKYCRFVTTSGRIVYKPCKNVRRYKRTGIYKPWTKAWIAHCKRKYKSFNPRTGRYLAFSGKYRFCR